MASEPDPSGNTVTLSAWLGTDPCWERVIMVIVIGAALGAACATAVSVLIVLPQDARAALPVGIRSGMTFGIPLGALLAPIMWSLLRDAPIRVVVRDTAIGTIAGSLLGFGVTLPLQQVRELDGIVGFGLLSGAIAGLVTASLRLRSHNRRVIAGRSLAMPSRSVNVLQSILTWLAMALFVAGVGILIIALLTVQKFSVNTWTMAFLACGNAALMSDSYRARPALARRTTFVASTLIVVIIVLLTIRGIFIERALAEAMR